MATPQITRALYEEGRKLQEELDISIKERGHTYTPLKEIATGYNTILIHRSCRGSVTYNKTSSRTQKN